MISITIGRDVNNKYIIYDPTSQVSSQHAELKIDSGGKMSLIDNSTNGTTVNGRRLSRFQTVDVTRGDRIVFANVALLDWGKIPSIQPIRDIQHHLTIGKGGDNNYQLSGNNTSRHHATASVNTKGKVFIMDHSMNGTYVDGQKITPYQYVPVKRGSKVSFANTDNLNWKKIPGGPAVNKWALIIPISFILLGLGGWFLWQYLQPVKGIEEYKKTVVLVYNKFYFTRQIVVRGKTTTLAYYGQDGGRVLDKNKLNEIKPFEVYGTGFFISNDGKIITNRHVAEPWKEEDFKKAFTAYLDFLYDVGVGGYSTEIGIIPNEKEVSKDDVSKSLVSCDPESVKSHDNPKVDLAIMQITSKTLPAGADYVRKEDISASKQDVTVSDEVVIMGYPLGLGLWDDSKPVVQNSSDFGKVSMIKNQYQLQYNANTAGGASGSPVINTKTGRVIAINTYRGTGDHNLGIFSYYIKDLLNE